MVGGMRWTFLRVLGLCAVVGLGAAAIRCAPWSPPPSAEAVERDLRNGLAVGATRAEIEAYLKQRGLDYFYHEREHRYLMLLENVETRWIVTSRSIQIIVTLDEAQRLRDIRARDVWTGP
jgi:hypothetical protein